MVVTPEYETGKPTRAQLYSGDKMTQKEFHQIYESMPDEFRAELLGGIVFVAMPLGRPHGRGHLTLSSIFCAYQASTPGIEACDSVTTILGKADEVQPDLQLRFLPDFGGQTLFSYDAY